MHVVRAVHEQPLNPQGVTTAIYALARSPTLDAGLKHQ